MAIRFPADLEENCFNEKPHNRHTWVYSSTTSTGTSSMHVNCKGVKK